MRQEVYIFSIFNCTVIFCNMKSNAKVMFKINYVMMHHLIITKV